MYLNTIDENTMVRDIVVSNYRTADVFRQYDIDYCCTARVPLRDACEMRGLDTKSIKTELERVMTPSQVSPFLNFADWPLDFLMSYIVRVHHAYLFHTFPLIEKQLELFIEGHRKQYPYLDELQGNFNMLHKTMVPHLREEENIIFPYIRQLSNAYANQEPYARLLVRTLRKPLELAMQQDQELAFKTLEKLRHLTDRYTPPVKACISHQVVYSKLHELDNDLLQHMHLENNFLFPTAIRIEKELLKEN